MSPAVAESHPIAATLESKGITVSLTEQPELDRFVSDVNARARIKGLDDAVNPGILDPAKLRAMVALLPAQAEEVRAALAGHTLMIDAPVFGVLAVEPTRADAFGPNYRITIRRVAGTHVLAAGNAAMDPALGRLRSEAARSATEAADKAVRAAEKGRHDPDGMDLGGLRWRRAQAAIGWRIAARGWKSAAPGDRAAARAVAAAEKAATTYDMPSGGLI